MKVNNLKNCPCEVATLGATWDCNSLLFFEKYLYWIPVIRNPMLVKSESLRRHGA